MVHFLAKVLIVDDDLSMCQSISRILTIEGYECGSVDGALEAIKELKSGNYDLVISDVLMPGVSGNVLLSEVSEKFSDLAVVMMSAQDNKETFVRCLMQKGYGYLIKPFSENQLLICIKNALLVRDLLLENRKLKKE